MAWGSEAHNKWQRQLTWTFCRLVLSFRSFVQIPAIQRPTMTPLQRGPGGHSIMQTQPQQSDGKGCSWCYQFLLVIRPQALVVACARE